MSSDPRDRCRAHPAFHADNCPACGTATVISADVPADPLLTGPEAAALCDLTPGTWRGYVSRGYAPPADEPDDDRPPNRRNPKWRQSTIEKFKATRSGQGSRTDTREATR